MYLELLLLPLVIGLVRGKDHKLPEITHAFDKDHSGIRCPACKWRPAKHDAWACNPGCGHVWNTFETRGECPTCEKRWLQTQCMRCSVWSPHDDWYEDPEKS
jgi:hypothetical protein